MILFDGSEVKIEIFEKRALDLIVHEKAGTRWVIIREISAEMRIGTFAPITRVTDLYKVKATLRYFSNAYWRRRDSHGHIPEKYRHREQVIAGPYTIILETGHYRGNPEFRFTCVPQREGFPEREINLDIIAVTALEDALGRVLGKITLDGSLL